MILPDVNVLVFAFRREAAEHDRYAAWLTAAWEAFAALARADPQIRGNLVPDSWLAALAIAHRCRLATADRGFARFPDLDWFDPVALR